MPSSPLILYNTPTLRLTILLPKNQNVMIRKLKSPFLKEQEFPWKTVSSSKRCLQILNKPRLPSFYTPLSRLNLGLATKSRCLCGEIICSFDNSEPTRTNGAQLVKQRSNSNRHFADFTFRFTSLAL